MQVLPIVDSQPSLPAALQDIDDGILPYEDIWISCYSQDVGPSVHAKVLAILDERKRDQINLTMKEGAGDVQISKIHDRAYAVSCKSLDISSTTVLTPVQVYSDPSSSTPHQPQRISAFDVSPDCTQYAVGHLDGSVYIYPIIATSQPAKYMPQVITACPHLKKRAKPHLSSVTTMQFFPSSRVLLTAGLDFSLTILPADPFPDHNPETAVHRISPARVLRSHTRSITGVGIIPARKQVLSSSLDSTTKLWDIPSGSVITTFSARSPVNSMSVGYQQTAAVDEAETQTLLKDPAHLVFCGLQSGHFQVLDMRTGMSVFYSSPSSATHGPLAAITCSHQVNPNLFATGSGKGVVAVYDVRSLTSPLVNFRRNEAGIEDISFLDFTPSSVSESASGLGLAIAASDGLPYVADLNDLGSIKVGVELAGVNCDAARGIRTRGRDVWCASDDAAVRKYSVFL